MNTNNKQLKILQRMSGEERLKQAFELSDLVRELARRNIQDSGITDSKEITKKLQARMYPK